MKPKSPIHSAVNFLLTFAIVTGVLLAVWLLWYRTQSVPSRHRAQVAACMSNLKSMGIALGMYSTDFGQVPSELRLLTPNYLKRIPHCQAAGKDTYTPSYTLSERSSPKIGCFLHGNDGPCRSLITEFSQKVTLFYQSEGRWPQSPAELNLPEDQTSCPFSQNTSRTFDYSMVDYEIYCKGLNHPERSLPIDYPRYHSELGIMETYRAAP